ncbi:hypothetical protein CAL26_09180 [Bordetella genomosp. 9]|uniref:Uncharacterized protein n=2 Tax=Bordetella TaxID=517 RepID=A0A261RH14_9BORD|nr:MULTISPECIES: phage regulatory CII family protein [Bordetella]ANN78923.1 hypothetical protein BAU07_18970 [Bordetella flabilis]OZI23603.1 hypothetical protein CAL26_09180 [Bordetella genomosp. 9]
MNILDAAYATVHDYPGGSESLGPRVNVSAAVLRNKVNPNNDTHHLTVAEAQRIVGVTGDMRMIEAWAREHGRVVVKVPGADECVSDMDVLTEVVSMNVQVGHYMQAIHAALADGKVDKAEIATIREKAMETQAEVARLVACLEGMAES